MILSTHKIVQLKTGQNGHVECTDAFSLSGIILTYNFTNKSGIDSRAAIGKYCLNFMK